MGLPAELTGLVDAVAAHNRWRGLECVNLIASENVMSPLARAVYSSDMMHRYAEGRPGRRFYQGVRYVDEVEVLVSRVIGELLGVRFVEPRAISGTVANATVFRVLGGPGDRALIAPVQAGAHVSHTRFGTLGALGIEHVELPFDLEAWNIDVDRSAKLVREVRPKFVTLGASVYLFPHPTKEIAQAAREVGAYVVHDVAHVLGLIVGRRWPNPIHEGADIATSSTHKTFPGPQGGLIFTNSEDLYRLVARHVFPWFVSNHHLHRLPATAVTAIEMKYFGEAYADQVVRNARAFAEALASEGFRVVAENLGYTRSHTLVVDVRDLGGGAKVAKLLEDANIIVNKNLLPWDPPDAVRDPSGIRLGTQEMTRYGMTESDFREVARLMREVLVDGRDVGEVRRKVVELRRNFLEVKYTFKVDPGLLASLSSCT